MRLVSAVLGFLLRKLGLVAAVVLSLFLGLLLMSALVPALREAEADRDRLAEVAQERADLEAELDGLESAYAAAQSKVTESLQAEIDAEIERGRLQVSDQESEVGRPTGGHLRPRGERGRAGAARPEPVRGGGEGAEGG